MADRGVIASLQAQIDSIIDSGAASPAGSARPSSRTGRGPGSQQAGVRPASPDDEGGACQADDGLRAQDADAAFKKIVDLVNAADRSERAIRERLAKAGFSEPAVDSAVNRARDCSFIDDMRFAEVLVRSRVSQGRGSAGIARELEEHGISPDSVPGWPCEYPLSSDEEIERALGILDRKPLRSKNLREGAYRRLVQKGYPSSVASSAARMWCERNAVPR